MDEAEMREFDRIRSLKRQLQAKNKDLVNAYREMDQKVKENREERKRLRDEYYPIVAKFKELNKKRKEALAD